MLTLGWLTFRGAQTCTGRRRKKEKAQKKRKEAKKAETKAAGTKMQKPWAKKWSTPP